MKWNDIKIVLEYGMLSEDKFYDKAKDFVLYPTIDNKFYTFEELKETIKANQTNKEGKIVVLYTSNKDAQHSYIADAKTKGYEVILLDSPIVPHLIQKLEMDNQEVIFTRVDADSIENLIKKDEEVISKLSETETTKLKEEVEKAVAGKQYNIQTEALDSNAAPFLITQPEFMRRMKEMQAMGGGNMFGNFPETYNVIVNTNSEIASKIINEENEAVKTNLIKQALDLAKLAQGLLKGEELTEFVKRNFEKI